MPQSFNDFTDILGSFIPAQGTGIGDPMDYFQTIPQQPIAQQTSSGPESYIPQNYLNTLAGLPGLSFDSMGRYGITDDQRLAAQRQGMGDMLMGVAQGFLNLDTMAPMKGGALAGQNMEAMLSGYSNQNLKNQLANMDYKINQLKAFGLMSDIEKGQVVLESAKMDLDSKKRANEALQATVEHFTPLIGTIEEIAATKISPEKAAEVRGLGSVIRAQLARGDVQGAMTLLNEKLAPIADLDPDTMKANLVNQMNAGLAKIEVTADAMPRLKALAKELGTKVDVGADGSISFLNPWEEAKRKMEQDKTAAYLRTQEAAAAENEAQAEWWRNRPPDGSGDPNKFTPAQIESAQKAINAAVASADQFINKLKIDPADTEKLDQTLGYAEKEKFMVEFSKLGVPKERIPSFIASWKAWTPQERADAVKRILGQLRGAQSGG